MASPAGRMASGSGHAVLLQVSAALLLAGVVFTAGIMAGLPLGHSRSPVVSESSKAATYDRVRAANITVLEQALDHIRGDCRVDQDRCSLSLAYALSLDQKFHDELAAIDVPACASDYDRQLRAVLGRIQDSIKLALAGLGSTAVVAAGLSDLQALDRAYAISGCAP